MVELIYKGISYKRQNEFLRVFNQERFLRGEKPFSKTHASRFIAQGRIEELTVKYDFKMSKKSPKQKQKPIVVDGIKYDNIELIFKKSLAKSEKEIFQNVIDLNILNWHYLKSMNNFNPIVIDNEVFPNVQSAIKLGVSNDHRKIKRLLNSKNHPNCYTVTDPSKIDYWFEQFELLKQTNNSLKTNNKLNFNITKKGAYEYKIQYNNMVHNSFLDFVAYYNGHQKSKNLSMVDSKCLKKRLGQNEIPGVLVVDKVLTTQKVPLSIKINNNTL